MLAISPVVAILGPRQAGKSTLARMHAAEDARLLRLDLERPGDLLRLDDPEAFFAANSQRLICVDEIQRRPELFPVIRYWGDRGFWISVDDLQITRRWVVAPIREPFASRGIHYASLTAFIDSAENADLFDR